MNNNNFVILRYFLDHNLDVELLLYNKAEKFLNNVRIMMHYYSNSSSDRLTFQINF